MTVSNAFGVAIVPILARINDESFGRILTPASVSVEPGGTAVLSADLPQTSSFRPTSFVAEDSTIAEVSGSIPGGETHGEVLVRGISEGQTRIISITLGGLTIWRSVVGVVYVRPAICDGPRVKVFPAQSTIAAGTASELFAQTEGTAPIVIDWYERFSTGEELILATSASRLSLSTLPPGHHTIFALARNRCNTQKSDPVQVEVRTADRRRPTRR